MDNYKILLKCIPKKLLQALIGQLLRDGHVELYSSGNGRRVKWTFGQHYEVYAKYLESLFRRYLQSGVYSGTRKVGNKAYRRFQLSTISFPFFINLHTMFYVYNAELATYVKIVPSFINEIMSPIVLAHMIIGDGNFHPTQHYVRIMTNSYTLAECQMLRDAITNIGIVTKVMKDKVGKNGEQQYLLTIRKSQIGNLQLLVGKHLHESFLYRVGLGKKSPVCV